MNGTGKELQAGAIIVAKASCWPLEALALMRGFSQGDLASFGGVSLSAIEYAFRRHRLSARMAQALAAPLRVDPSVLQESKLELAALLEPG
ncbi:MAG: hypothetical protein O7H41_20305 [Planctomycetota bacterium]|nr:hypothetical protein [Planctomycetota bacterium]